MGNINKYALTALKAVQDIKEAYSITEIWSRTAKVLIDTKTSQEKSCPKGIFF